MTQSQHSSYNPNSSASVLPSYNSNFPEITINVYKFKIFDKEFLLVAQSNYFNMLDSFIFKLNNFVDYDVAKKELILEYYAQEHPELSPDKVWSLHNRIPQACKILSSFETQENLESNIKKSIIEHHRDKKINDILK